MSQVMVLPSLITIGSYFAVMTSSTFSGRLKVEERGTWGICGDSDTAHG